MAQEIDDQNSISEKKTEVVVIGDFYWDTVIVPESTGGKDTYARIDRQAGAWLLYRLIDQARHSIPNIKISGYPIALSEVANNVKEEVKLSRADKWGRALTVVKPFPKVKPFAKGVEDYAKEKIYRIESRYGWARHTEFKWSEQYPPETPPETPIDISTNKYKEVFEAFHNAIAKRMNMNTDIQRRIVVINDNNHVFRHLDSSRTIICELGKLDKCFFIVALGQPDVQDSNKIWTEIKKHCEKTAIVVSATGLRSAGLNIPEHQSLESAACSLVQHMQKNSVIGELLGACQHLLVRDINGVFHFDKALNAPPSFNYYCRPYKAGPEADPERNGRMSGYGKILITSIAQQMLQNQQSAFDVNISKGIRLALTLWEKNFKNGFSCYDFPHAYFPQSDPELHPYDHLFLDKDTFTKNGGKDRAKDLGEPPFAKVQFPYSQDLKTWSRVAWLREEIKNEDRFRECLSKLVKDTPEDGIRRDNDELILCPFARLGELIAVDREEIDGFSAIYRIINKYMADSGWETPLCMAVFGPPGSGKSFTVREILKVVRSSSGRAEGGGEAYNLAQFTAPENLTTAFHQIQSKALFGDTPLIFFDEFDANLGQQRYGWLKYFLAPMQDGKFKGLDGTNYRVGKAIFVFAGGTAETFEDFETAALQEYTLVAPGHDLTATKIKDFISRLRGHLNINGINTKEGEASVSDLLAVRRAIILRAILERKATEIFDGKTARIADGLIRAFLWVDNYHHGVRSMEAIVEMSKPENGWLRVASLPSRSQLRMHVDDDQFLDLTK